MGKMWTLGASGKNVLLVHDQFRMDEQMYEWDVERSERRPVGRAGRSGDGYRSNEKFEEKVLTLLNVNSRSLVYKPIQLKTMLVTYSPPLCFWRKHDCRRPFSAPAMLHPGTEFTKKVGPPVVVVWQLRYVKKQCWQRNFRLRCKWNAVP